jgi:hypothetical protein
MGAGDGLFSFTACGAASTPSATSRDGCFGQAAFTLVCSGPLCAPSAIRPRSCSYAAVRRCAPSPCWPNWAAQREFWRLESHSQTLFQLRERAHAPPGSHSAHRQQRKSGRDKARPPALGWETQEPQRARGSQAGHCRACAGMSKGPGQRRCLIYLPVLFGTSSINLAFWARGWTSNSATPSHTT